MERVAVGRSKEEQKEEEEKDEEQERRGWREAPRAPPDHPGTLGVLEEGSGGPRHVRRVCGDHGLLGNGTKGVNSARAPENTHTRCKA